MPSPAIGRNDLEIRRLRTGNGQPFRASQHINYLRYTEDLWGNLSAEWRMATGEFSRTSKQPARWPKRVKSCSTAGCMYIRYPHAAESSADSRGAVSAPSAARTS